MTPPGSLPCDVLSVRNTEDGRVAVTVLLPADLVSTFCGFFRSISDLFQGIQRKTSADALHRRIHSEQEAQRVSLLRSEYRARLVTSFDSYRLAGLDRHEAVKRVAADLRAESHPWSAVHLVRSELVAAGRGGSPGRPRSTSRGQS